jgi:hypothetical protein
VKRRGIAGIDVVETHHSGTDGIRRIGMSEPPGGRFS